MDLVNQIYNKFSGNNIDDNIKLQNDKNEEKNDKTKKKCCLKS